MKKKFIDRGLAMLGIPHTAQKKWREVWAQEVAVQKAAGAGEVLVYGPIVSAQEEAWIQEFYGDEVVVSDVKFREQLKAIEGSVVVRINSPGGEVWAASSMLTALMERRNGGDQVVAIVDGLAASAASLVMLGGEKIRLSPLASIMVHQAHGFEYGTASDFREMADFLDKSNREVAGVYAKRMGTTAAKLLTEWGKDTDQWYSASEAVESGLADEIVEVVEKKSPDMELRRRRIALQLLGES